jgi:hypothetical protein
MLHCPRCQRSHPDEAAFCYFDGTPLRGEKAAAPAAPGQLPFDFIFPSGQRCRSFDELIQACQQDWPAARALFEEGAFRQYLTAAGRLDLARAHDEAREQCPDPDIAFASFLDRLPAQRPLRPELELQPRRLLLDPMSPGESRTIELVVLNVGSGLLHGMVQVVEGSDWLRLVGGGPDTAIKTTDEQAVLLEIHTHGLSAPQSLAAHLTVITNGGVVEAPVRLVVKPRPFPHAPYAGAATPRELAVRIRDNPRPAIALLEAGDVARWFESNGWPYPVKGPTALGMAAVQQYFETLQLAKTPRVEINPTMLELECQGADPIAAEAYLHSPDRKWVFGAVTTAASWLRVLTPRVSGPQSASIRLELEPATLTANDTHEATVTVQANGGQTLTLPLRLRVTRPQESWTKRLLRPAVIGALVGLTVRMLVAEPAAHLAGRPDGAVAGSPMFIRHFVFSTCWLGMLAGLIAVLRRPGWRWGDIVCGALAGGAGGIIAAGTLASALPVVDALLGPLGAPPLLTAGLSWLLLGAAGGAILASCRPS